MPRHGHGISKQAGGAEADRLFGSDGLVGEVDDFGWFLGRGAGENMMLSGLVAVDDRGGVYQRLGGDDIVQHVTNVERLEGPLASGEVVGNGLRAKPRRTNQVVVDGLLKGANLQVRD